MSPIDLLLARLQPYRLRETAPGRWRACCPAHEGTNPQALSVAIGDTGAVLLHCWRGCEVEQIAQALGLELADLFPPKESSGKRIRGAWVPSDAFDVARAEVALVATIAGALRHDQVVSDEDWNRLALAAQRLDDIARIAYAR